MDDSRSEIHLITSVFELERSGPALLRQLVQDVCCPSAARLDHDGIQVGDRKGARVPIARRAFSSSRFSSDVSSQRGRERSARVTAADHLVLRWTTTIVLV